MDINPLLQSRAMSNYAPLCERGYNLKPDKTNKTNKTPISLDSLSLCRANGQGIVPDDMYGGCNDITPITNVTTSNPKD